MYTLDIAQDLLQSIPDAVHFIAEQSCTTQSCTTSIKILTFP